LPSFNSVLMLLLTALSDLPFFSGIV